MADNEEENTGEENLEQNNGGGTYEYDENDTDGQNAPIPDGTGGDSTNVISSEQDPNTRFITNVLYENNGSVYGLEVLLFDIDDNPIENIIVVDETSFDGWTELITKLSEAYVPYTEQDGINLSLIKSEREKIGTVKEDGEIYTYTDYTDFLADLEWSKLKEVGSLEDILKNDKNEFEINATKFMGKTVDDFSKVGHTHNFAETKHSSPDNSYGVGTTDLYGHVKVVNNLNTPSNVSGEALSAYQGKVLNDKINSINTQNTWSNIIKVNEWLWYRVNEDLRLVVCDYYRGQYKGLTYTGEHELHKPGTISKKYAPTNRVNVPTYRGDLVLYFKQDGSVNVYNLSVVQNMSFLVQAMWHY